MKFTVSGLLVAESGLHLFRLTETEVPAHGPWATVRGVESIRG